MALPPSSVLFITLDSCRFDTFRDADAPNLKSIGELHRAHAPGNFTYASHAAMFVGFTPGRAECLDPYLNPKFGRIFRLSGGGGGSGTHEPYFSLSGRDIVQGFGRLGYRTVGTGAMAWFDTTTAVSSNITRSFDSFLYVGNTGSFQRQREFLMQSAQNVKKPLFAFLNVGETHVPYWYRGAPWDRRLNPCQAFGGSSNDATECRRRQRACVEWIDREIEPLLDAFQGANIVLCADHGDVWGEDGLWEHGIHHPSVLEVPLVYRLVAKPAQSRRQWLGRTPLGMNAARVAGRGRRLRAEKRL